MHATLLSSPNSCRPRCPSLPKNRWHCPSKPERVWPGSRRNLGSYADPSGVLLAVRSVGGVCGAIEMAPYQTTADWQERACISFAKGYIEVKLPPPLASQQAGEVTVMRDRGDGPCLTRPNMPRVSAMRRQAENFLAAVRGERPAPCEAAEAVEDLRAAKRYIEMLVEARR